MELVLRRPRTESEYERVLRTQLEVINEMARVVEQLLAVAHAEDGQWAVDWKPAELGPLVQAVREIYQGIANQKQVALEIFEQEQVWVRGEATLLERLIANLVENALKHTPAGGKVKIELIRRNGEAVCKVEDTGAGIPAEEMPRLFDKFFTQKTALQQGAQSTGIGLGLCRWIAEVHQGKIEVASPPGRGAVFTVLLPLFEPEMISQVS